MSDDFAFDDFDEEPLSGEPPKKAAQSPPVRPPQRPAPPAPPAPPAAQKTGPPVVPAAKDEPDFDFEDDFDAVGYPSKETKNTKQKPLKAKGGGRSPRSMLLLLLLLLVAGAGYYFMVFLPGQEPPAPAPVAQSQVAKPVPPPPGAQAVPPKPAQTAAQSQAVPAAPAQTAVAPPPAPKPAAPAASPAAASKPAATTAAQPVPPPPATKPTPGATAASATPAAASAKPVPAKTAPEVVAKAPPSPALSGNFQLHCGPFALRENWLAAEKKVRQIGYEPRVSTIKRPIAMTRLRVGNYPPQEAEARRADLAARYPGAFLVAREDQRILYAGSFQNLDEARRLADRLYRDGIRTEEETVKVNVPLKLVSFGDFADRATAEQAAGKARTAGLEVEIAGRR